MRHLRLRKLEMVGNRSNSSSDREAAPQVIEEIVSIPSYSIIRCDVCFFKTRKIVEYK